jgi:hypothetical protein
MAFVCSWLRVGLLWAIAPAAAGCRQQAETMHASATASAVRKEAAAPTASASGSQGVAGEPPGRPGDVARRCALPEPVGKKLATPDASYARSFDAVAKCEDDSHAPCEAAEALVGKAKDSARDSGVAPAPVVAACTKGLGHESKRARMAAADCLIELWLTVKERAPVVAILLDKLEATSDHVEQLAYASAAAKLDAAGAGYTCRVLRMIEARPKNDAVTGQLVGSLMGVMTHANDEGFDYAYELLMSDQRGAAITRAMDLILHGPAARKGEVCDRLGAIVRAGYQQWGRASYEIWRDEGCNHRDAVIANAVAKLEWLGTLATYQELEGPLHDANFIDDLPTWNGISEAQKKSVCDAARALAANGKDEDARRKGKTIATSCDS